MTSKNTLFLAKKYTFDPIYFSIHLGYLERGVLRGVPGSFFLTFLERIKMNYHELFVLVLFVALLATVAVFQSKIGK